MQTCSARCGQHAGWQKRLPASAPSLCQSGSRQLNLHALHSQMRAIASRTLPQETAATARKLVASTAEGDPALAAYNIRLLILWDIPWHAQLTARCSVNQIAATAQDYCMRNWRICSIVLRWHKLDVSMTFDLSGSHRVAATVQRAGVLPKATLLFSTKLMSI